MPVFKLFWQSVVCIPVPSQMSSRWKLREKCFSLTVSDNKSLVKFFCKKNEVPRISEAFWKQRLLAIYDPFNTWKTRVFHEFQTTHLPEWRVQLRCKLACALFATGIEYLPIFNRWALLVLNYVVFEYGKNTAIVNMMILPYFLQWSAYLLLLTDASAGFIERHYYEIHIRDQLMDLRSDFS